MGTRHYLARHMQNTCNFFFPRQRIALYHAYAVSNEQHTLPFIPNSYSVFDDSLGLHPLETLTYTLHDCIKEKNLANAWKLYLRVLANGLESSSILRDCLVVMFVECGSLATGKILLHRLPCNTTEAHVRLIHMLVKIGEFQKAISMFKHFDIDSRCPDRYLYQALLKACGVIRCIYKGQNLHCDIVKKGFDSESFVGVSLVDMYAKNGMLEEAQLVFENLSVKDVVPWSALIWGYTESGCHAKAIESFSKMCAVGVVPNAVTFMCSLKACGLTGNIDKGRETYADLAEEGYEKDPRVASTLISMYINCDCMEEAQEVFDELPVKDVVLWTTLIGGYSEKGHWREALTFLEKMQAESFIPNAVTSVCALKACSSLGSSLKGRGLHIDIIKKGFDTDRFVITALMDMYISCGLLIEAQGVFDKLPAAKGVVVWNVLIAGFVDHKRGQEALERFNEMQLQGLSPDVTTFVCILKACLISGLVSKGQSLHMEVVKSGFEKNPFVGISLLDLYGKCGAVEEAQVVFDNLSTRNVVAWNALIMGYSQHGFGQKALSSLSRMHEEGVPIDAITAVCSLKACVTLGEINRGRWIHGQSVKQSLIEEDDIIGSALVTMYVKCNSLLEAQKVFDCLASKDAISWGTLLLGYAYQGAYELVVCLFNEMQKCGVHPDGGSLLSVLIVCSHTGLTEKGLEALFSLSKEHAISPTLEHYNCMIDVLGRAGQLEQAATMLNEMPFHPSFVSWISLLGSCRKIGNIGFAEQAFESVAALTQNKGDLLIMMWSIYAEK